MAEKAFWLIECLDNDGSGNLGCIVIVLVKAKYSTAQLQGNECMWVTHEKVTCIAKVLARVLASRGLARIQTCEDAINKM